jgi:hypothetical protein
MIRLRLETADSDRKRPASHLNARLDKDLLAYATAATVAGVGVLAMAQPAEAKIIYTKANTPIVVDGGAIPLDLNNDGITDFAFYNSYTIGGGVRRAEGTHGGAAVISPAQKVNEISEITSHKIACAAALDSGERVGPRKPLMAKSLLMAANGGNYTNGGSAFGPWEHVQQAYLGLKFSIKGKMHYGWARIKWGGVGQTDYITGYAYETIANKLIITGKTKGTDEGSVVGGGPVTRPIGLGTLAQGAGASK